MEKLHRDRSLARLEDAVMNLVDYFELVGLTEIRDREAKYKAFGEKFVGSE